MAKKVYEESKISAIADAIREKTGGDETYTTSQIPYGINEVYKAGQNTGFDTMWGAIQQNGARHIYDYFFDSFNPDLFYPKYDIVLASQKADASPCGDAVFKDFGKNQAKTIDLTQRLTECGVTLNTRASKRFTYFMLGAYFSRVPTIDMTNCVGSYMAFYNARFTIIDKLIISETTGFSTNTFQYCSWLNEISEIEGVIGVSIAFQNSPLNAATINRIIACLKDYSSIGGTYTLTLKKDRETMLTDAEKAVATNKGWTLVWS